MRRRSGRAPPTSEPDRKRKRSRRGSLVAPRKPGEQISREEFQELVRDLDVDQPASPKPGGRRSDARAAGTGVAQRPARTEREDDVQDEQPQAERPEPGQPRDPTADLTPEGPRPQGRAEARQTPNAHASPQAGSSAVMGLARLGDAWALRSWHFTIFLEDEVPRASDRPSGRVGWPGSGRSACGCSS